MRSVCRTTASIIASGRFETAGPNLQAKSGLASQQLLHAAQYLHAGIFLSALFSMREDWYVACFAPFEMVLRQALPQSAWSRVQERDEVFQFAVPDRDGSVAARRARLR